MRQNDCQFLSVEEVRQYREHLEGSIQVSEFEWRVLATLEARLGDERRLLAAVTRHLESGDAIFLGLASTPGAFARRLKVLLQAVREGRCPFEVDGVAPEVVEQCMPLLEGDLALLKTLDAASGEERGGL